MQIFTVYNWGSPLYWSVLRYRLIDWMLVSYRLSAMRNRLKEKSFKSQVAYTLYGGLHWSWLRNPIMGSHSSFTRMNIRRRTMMIRTKLSRRLRPLLLARSIVYRPPQCRVGAFDFLGFIPDLWEESTFGAFYYIELLVQETISLYFTKIIRSGLHHNVNICSPLT